MTPSERPILLSCPACEHTVSSHAPTCPSCGHPFQQQLEKAGSRFQASSFVFFGGVCSLVCLLICIGAEAIWDWRLRELVVTYGSLGIVLGIISLLVGGILAKVRRGPRTPRTPIGR